jgi:hypothetical protein
MPSSKGGFRAGREAKTTTGRKGSPRQKAAPKPPPGAKEVDVRQTPDFIKLMQQFPLITVPEYLVFRWLERRMGWRYGVEFMYLDYLPGLGVDTGLQQVDFTTITMLALPVDGVFFHIDKGADQRARDLMSKAMLQMQGYTVCTLLDIDLTTRLEATMQAAMAGQEMPTVEQMGSNL